MTTQLDYFTKAIEHLDNDGGLTKEKVIDIFKLTNPYHTQMVELTDEYRFKLLDKLTKVVNEYYGISVKNRTRYGVNVRGRKVFIYIAMEMNIVSGVRLARHLSKDHSTISTMYHKTISDITPIRDKYIPDQMLFNEIQDVRKLFLNVMI